MGPFLAPSAMTVREVWRPRPEVLAWCLRALGATALRRVIPLGRGYSHDNLLLVPDGGVDPAVLRRQRSGGPERAATALDREADVARRLAPTGIAVPRVVAADPHGRECGEPVLLHSFVDGRPPTRCFARTPEFVQFAAEALCAVHRIDAYGWGLPAATVPVDLARVGPPLAARDRCVWDEAACLARALAPSVSGSTLLHGDFHAGNTLWRSGRLLSLVDWESARRGPPAADLATMRFNLAATVGIEVADAFGSAYGRIAHDSESVFWDICTTFDILTDIHVDEETTANIEQFLESLLRHTT